MKNLKWIGLTVVLLSSFLGIALANLFIDGTTEIVFTSYINNFSQMFRILGLGLILISLFSHSSNNSKGM